MRVVESWLTPQLGKGSIYGYRWYLCSPVYNLRSKDSTLYITKLLPYLKR